MMSNSCDIRRGDPDVWVAALAFERGRIIVTYDFDFGELAIRDRMAVVGVLLIDLSQFRDDHRITAAVSPVDRLGDELTGRLTVVGQRIRQRRLEGN